MDTFLGNPDESVRSFIENNPPVTIFYLSDGTKRFSETKGTMTYEETHQYSNIVKICGSKGISALDGGCFDQMTSLTDAVFNYVEKFNEYATFNGCTNLSSVSLPKLKTMDFYGNCFEGTKIKNIYLPNLETAPVCIGYGGSFETINCPKLTAIDSGGAMYNTTTLRTVKLDSCQKLGPGVFAGCSNLSSVYVPKLQYIEYEAFQYNSMLTSIDLPEIIEIANESNSGSPFERSGLKKITFGKKI